MFFQPIIWVRTPCLDSKGGATSESFKPQCLVSSFELGSVSGCHHGRQNFFVFQDSHFAVQYGYINKTAAFLNVVPLQLHCKIARNFVCGATFENQMLGFRGD